MSVNSRFVLVAPGIGSSNELVRKVIEEALLSFFLAYSLPDEIYDDHWYFNSVREYFFDEDGLPSKAACNSEQEYWNYCRDSSAGIAELSETISSHLEAIIEINDKAIDQLYDRKVFNVPFGVVFHPNAVTLAFKG